MTVDDIIAVFNEINSRRELLTFLDPLRVPEDLDEFDRGRLTSALVAAASRAWKSRT